MNSLGLIALLLAISSPSPAFEKHPEIEDALRALHNARTHLEHAAHDFGGHRVNALKHVNEALEECRLALEADKK